MHAKEVACRWSRDFHLRWLGSLVLILTFVPSKVFTLFMCFRMCGKKKLGRSKRQRGCCVVIHFLLLHFTRRWKQVWFAVMGIKGLWKELGPVCRAAHISQFRGLRVGVDTYCWIHRATIASVVALTSGQPCDKYLQFIASRLDLLQRFGVVPLLVFDGQAMPMKQNTDEARQQRRQAALVEGRALLAAGNVTEALKCLEKGLEVTPALAYTVIQMARARGVECIVAPYEADAQLAYLCKEGYVQAVVSEDSDLVVYNCAVLVAKMDGQGNCDVVRIRDVPLLPGMGGLTYENFVLGCIVSGCDYVSSLPGVGMKTALKTVASAKTIPQIVAALGSAHTASSRDLQTYEEQLNKAFYCFAHHLVYDPSRRCVVHFTPLPEGVPFRSDLVGALWDAEVAQAVCGRCELDPTSLQPYSADFQQCYDLYQKRTSGGQQKLEECCSMSHPTQLTSVPPSAHRRTVSNQPISMPFVEAAKLRERRNGNRAEPQSTSDRTAPTEHRPVALHSKYFVDRALPTRSDPQTGKEPSALTRTASATTATTTTTATTSLSSSSSLSDVSSDTTSDKENVPDEAHTRDTAAPSDETSEHLPQRTSAGTSSGSSQHSPAEIDADNPNKSPTQQQLLCWAKAACPHGYAECGQPHSLFFRCYEGKNWKAPSLPKVASVHCSSEVPSGAQKRPRDTPTSRQDGDEMKIPASRSLRMEERVPTQPSCESATSSCPPSRVGSFSSKGAMPKVHGSTNPFEKFRFCK